MNFKNALCRLIFCLFIIVTSCAASATPKQAVNALYIPLADHYAAIVAYELYRSEMVYADFHIEQMGNWDLLRAYFQSGDVDMAFVMSPLAMDMYREKPHFSWIGLMHRDGNALAINDHIKQHLELPTNRTDRKPDSRVADVLEFLYQKNHAPTEIGMPHLLATHSVVLYRYLKENGLSLSLNNHDQAEVRAIAVPPPLSPAFIKGKSNKAQSAAFEQSLPWADIVETEGYGHVAWYSKDVMPWKHGHVECIAIATLNSVNAKQKAIREVMHAIHRAGEVIELARESGGSELDKIVSIVRKHIPAHTAKAIKASLDKELRVINYQNLNIDKNGLRQIMDLAVEGNILKGPIDIDAFADTNFAYPENNNE